MALEASAIALHDASLLREQAFIDGEWCDGDAGATFEVIDPATGEVLGAQDPCALDGRLPKSAIGREGSKYGVDEWVETRYLSLGGIEA